ncbi:hypothetical protein EYZ11_002731 [Aspergillus tanneri]|uniref:Uncharacterized protein n=1 Tax=Aspergillus tanneri TaxID=1220188 RepID=A0A4S3JQC3_9EURO|nr:hypothetical protein EYZ11_002731 [Aspergillus tanneri]
MKTKTSGPNLKGILKRRDVSEPIPGGAKRRQIHTKSSAPTLKSHNVTGSFPETSGRHQLLNKFSAPGFKSKRSEPYLTKSVTLTSSLRERGAPRSPLVPPQVPGLRKETSSWTVGATDKNPSAPRFMAFEKAKEIKPVRYRPCPKTTEFKMPTIIGCKPSRLRAVELAAKRETRSERILKAVRDPRGMVVKKCKVQADLSVEANQKGFSVEDAVLGNRRRFSTVATFSKSASASAFSLLNSGNGQGTEAQGKSVNEVEDDDRKVRASLIPYREWLVFLQGNTNPYNEDEESQKPTPPETPVPDQTHVRPLFSLSEDAFRNSPPSPPTSEDPLDSPSPTPSEVTITPANAHHFLKMSPSTASSSHDPFVDFPQTVREEKGDGKPCASHTVSIESAAHEAGRSSSSSEEEAHTLQPLRYRPGCETAGVDPAPNVSQPARDTKTQTYSRVLRGPAHLQAQVPALAGHKGARATPEPRSSIPVAIRKHSVEQMPNSQNEPGDTFSGGIRMVEKPRGPRPHQKKTAQKEPISKTERAESISSSSVSDWDFNDEPKRPTNVYTGEYRQRDKPHHGPTLKIAPSAEKIIMGAASEGSDYVVTQRSNPALVEYSDTPKRLQKKQNTDKEVADASPQSPDSSERTPLARNFCRPQISLEGFSRRDFSGRELAIQRKALHSPSSPSLSRSPAHSSPGPGPSVPSIPAEHRASDKGSVSATPPKSPLRALAPDSHGGGGSGPGSVTTTVRRFPPRTSSLQAVADFPIHSETASPADADHKRDVTFDDIVPKHPGGKVQVAPSGTGDRLVDSRSTRVLDSFRSIFKSRSTTEKGRGRQNENEPPGAASKDTTADSAKPTKDVDDGKSMKAKAKGWARTTRSSISPETQTTEDVRTPSFARPTKSTRTKAASNSRLQTPLQPDGRIRRAAAAAAASTGSPKRSSGAYRRSHVLMPQRISTPSRPIGSAHAIAMVMKDEAQDLSRKLDDIPICITDLCSKARDADTPVKREKYLKLALTLQQQFSDYGAAEKEAVEAEVLMEKKRGEKCVAENCLFEHFSHILAVMEED